MKRLLIFGFILWFCLTVGASQSRLKMEGRKTTASKTQLDSSASSSPYWARHYGGSGYESLSAQEASDNGYIACGRVRSSSIVSASGDIWLVKLDEGGYIEWQKSYDKGDDEQATHLINTPDGGYFVAAYTGSFYARLIGDILVMKLSSTGDVQWQQVFDSNAYDLPSAVVQTTDGGYLISGTSQSSGLLNMSALIIKLSSSGDIEWQQLYGEQTEGNSIIQTEDGGFIIAGERWPQYGGSDIWILKLDALGQVEWEKIYGDRISERANAIRQTSDGGYIVAGYNWIIVGVSKKTIGDIWILKLDSQGDIEWQRTYGGTEEEHAADIRHASDNGYIVTGSTNTFGFGKRDALVIKLSPTGDIEWQKTYGDIDNDGAGQVRILANGDYLVSGSFTLPYTGEQTDGLVMRISPNGEIDSRCGFYANAELLIMDTFVQPVDIQPVVRDTNVSSYPTDIIPQETTVKCQFICGYYKKKGTIKR